MMEEKVKKYREIRKRVYEEATKPIPYDENAHQTNKGLLKNKILDICSKANLDNFRGNDKQTIKLLWFLMWSKIFYAGFKAETASAFINCNKVYFSNYKIFNNDKWDLELRGKDIIKSGNSTNDFLEKKGIFLNKNVIAHRIKISKVINIARKLKKYVDNPNNDEILDFVTGRNTDVWEIHNHLLQMGYKGDLTALHFMMDIGFPVIKPDIVISCLFLNLGWLHEIIPDLPKDLTKKDLEGKGKYKTKYKYDKSSMYKPIIDLARGIVENTQRNDLKSDIGWVSNNPLREFDIFMVKSGQKPEIEFGITKQLYSLTNTSDNCSTSCPLRK